LQQTPSELLTANILSLEEVTDLFKLYFDNLHEHYPLLTQHLHTPESTNARSPFLFTCSAFSLPS